MATRPEPPAGEAEAAPSTSAAPTRSGLLSLWQRLLQWARTPRRVWSSSHTRSEELLLEAMARVNELATSEGRKFISLDDLFLTIDVDAPLRALLRQHGTSAEELTADVRAALAAVDPQLDRSGSRAKVLADGGIQQMNVVIESLAFASVTASDDDVAGLDSVALFAGCLREGPPSFVRDAFVRRTGHRRWDVLWPIAHRDVDVDDDAGTSTPMAALVIYNDDFTTQEFVTEVIGRHTELVDDDAHKFMWTVHAVGVSAVLSAPVERVRVMRDAIMRDARAAGHPLRVRVEPLVED
ncbi:MAG: ATP-dependent Clp protease adaptor ClpS [Deltaproteobacteria bacterium]|nr:ATP-dependent Clp protease adaptor ClpS [Deltaproteobacteria bacterium]